MADSHSIAAGLWDASADMESAAVAVLAPRLKPFEAVVRDCYECAVAAPTLPNAGNADDERLSYAGLFLKKSLTELRASWLLLRSGYTSPAAAIVASLWENALTASVVSTEPRILDEVRGRPVGETPWPPGELAKRWSTYFTRDKPSSHERVWRETYAPYKWLCKIKHPTLKAARYEALNATAARDGTYVIMAAPDIRAEDWPSKVTLLAIAVSRVSSATTDFLTGANADEKAPEFQRFGSQMRRVYGSVKLFKTAGPLPFDVADEKIAAEYRKLRASDSRRDV